MLEARRIDAARFPLRFAAPDAIGRVRDFVRGWLSPCASLASRFQLVSFWRDVHLPALTYLRTRWTSRAPFQPVSLGATLRLPAGKPISRLQRRRMRFLNALPDRRMRIGFD